MGESCSPRGVRALRRLCGSELAQMRDQQVARAVDVASQYRLGRGQVPCTRRLQQIPVLLSGLSLVATRHTGLVADEIDPQAGQVTVNVLQDVSSELAIGTLVEDGVELLMRITEEKRRFWILLHLIHQPFSFSQHLDRELVELVTQRDQLDGKARLVHFLHLLDGQRRNESAAIADGNDETESLQATQGLTDRALAYIEAGGEMILEKRVPRRELAAENLPAEPFGHELGCTQPVWSDALHAVQRIID